MKKLTLIDAETQKSLSTEIESPSHYIEGRSIEPIAVIEDWELSHHLACALKYIARAGRKQDEIKDLRKTVWYLQRRIKLLTNP